ncbi:MAG: UDP-galactopyranose mutase [Chthoniobacter sp.]|nr:UDP-galactopyranose mutase [Chthoniobacter sp.]
MTWDYLIVGAGFAGAVLAERLASQCGATCLVIDRRPHLGGNAHDHYDAAGVLVHDYGPHYFRTNSDRIVEYLSQFTEWHAVEYKILSWTHGRFWQFPINLNTFEQLLGRPSTSEEMERTLAEWRVPIAEPHNSEEVIVSQVGTRLYEMFFQNYTRKQWRRDPRELDASVCGRIPIRLNRDDRYLSEKFQALPRDGYTAMFRKILAHPKIEVRLGTDYREVRAQLAHRHLIFTGPLDEYFEHRFGPLPYRSLRFEPETLAQEYFQPAMQVNYPNDHDFTRIVELKHATGQRLSVTTIVREYPEDFGPGKEPYYPIPAPEARALYQRYADLAAAEAGVSFVGRLATYRYYNMDQVVGMALAEFEKLRVPQT